MSHFLGPIINNLQVIIEHGGYSILSLVTILEGMPLIGSLIPGHTIVILSGFLAKIGIFNLSAVVIIVTASAFAGDVIGYFLGRRYGLALLEKFGRYIFLKPEHIERARTLINKHTGKAIIFGRFNPITRSLIPFIIGTSHSSLRRFWFYDFMGVVIWAFGSIALGYVFGASYHVAAGLIGKFSAIALVVALILIFVYRFVNKRFHIFAKYELITLLFSIAGLYLFFKTIQDALTDKGFMAGLDVWINMFFTSHASAFGVTLMRIVTDVLSPSFLSVFMLAGVIYFIYKKSWRYATIIFLSLSGGLVLSAFVKEIVMRARPFDQLIVETGYSFPSGHAIMATIFFVLAIYLFSRKIHSSLKRESFIVISVLLIILTGVSRLYLGVHWASDVFAGIGLGVFWTTLMILAVRYVGTIVGIFKKFKL